MKKGIFLSTINWILLFSIPGILIITDINNNTSTINSSIDTKNLNTNLFQKVIDTPVVEKKVKDDEEVDVEEIEIPVVKKVEEQDVKIEKQEDKVVEKQEVSVKEEVKQQEVQTPKEEKKQSDVVATYSGKASYYTASCYGCSGYTSSGLNVNDGRVYYNDSSYGNVRIVAAGREIPLYSIIRLNNTKLGSNVLAIVLDRGGDIGQDRVFLIDILTNSSESFGGVDKNIKVEVLRSGR